MGLVDEKDDFEGGETETLSRKNTSKTEPKRRRTETPEPNAS